MIVINIINKYKLIFLLLIFLSLCYLAKIYFANIKINESFTYGYYPQAVDNVIAPNKYPRTKHNGISNNGSADIWWHYPIFTLGNYNQITNNLQYPNNPDEGTCMPASMCGALYHESKQKDTPSNITSMIPPLTPSKDNHPRVGFFYSKKPTLFLY